MSVLAVALIWLLVAVLVLLVLAIVMPLRFELTLNKDGGWKFNAALRPFGRFGPRIPLRGGSDSQEKPQTKHFRLRRNPLGLLRAILRLISEILHHVRIDTATLDVLYGCGDPAETGQVYGLIAPLIYSSAGISNAKVRVEPVFDQAVLRGCAVLNLSIIPATLLPPVLRFAWSIKRGW